jgi:hypothetical protein
MSVPKEALVNITPRIKNRLATVATEQQVAQEGLASMLLLLALSDRRLVDQAVGIIKTLDLHGATEMANKGW